MMTNAISTYKLTKALIVDIVILMIIYFVPTIAHYINYPLFYLEPMRIVLFLSIFILGDKRNAYILAVTLPLFSYMVSGHPVAVKNLVMAVELSLNVFILFKMLERNINPFVACFSSIVISKLVYYILKYLTITSGLMKTTLIDTPFIMQLLVAVFLSVAFMCASKNVR